jgi:ferrochelatase
VTDATPAKIIPTAVLLMAYGAAENLEDIPRYLQDIRGGRPANPELIAAVKERYRLMGGKSPLLDITRAQAAALKAQLQADGLDCEVYSGMRHSSPGILDAVKAIERARHPRVVAVPLTPYQSDLSTGAYFRKYQEAVQSTGGDWKTIRIESWCRQPAFIEACAQKVEDGIECFESQPCRVLFTGHSLPERVLKEGDTYPSELSETVQAVAKRIRLNSWEFAYQSRGQTSEPWLGPDAGETIDRLAREGCKNLLVAPIGFISDHMETLYDDDMLYRDQALRLGMRFERAETLNEEPLLIRAIAAAVEEALERAPAVP